MDTTDPSNILNYIWNHENKKKMFSSLMPAVIFNLHPLQYNILHFLMPEKIKLSKLSDLGIEIIFVKISAVFFSAYTSWLQKSNICSWRLSLQWHTSWCLSNRIFPVLTLTLIHYLYICILNTYVIFLLRWDHSTHTTF